MTATATHSKKSASRTLLALSLALVVSTYGWSQTQLGKVFGTITDSTGAVVVEAEVTLVNISTGLKRNARTDAKGQFYVAGLPSGKYTVRVEKESFQTEVREGIALGSGDALAINLSLAVGTVPQEVRVTADVVGVDSTSSTVGGSLDERNLAELPLNGRDLFKAAVLEPGVAPTPSSAPSLLSNGKTGQISIHGMRPSWTNVLIDGMDANDPVFGFSPAGASGLFLGLDEFAEVNVLTQTFNADYGNHGGGIVEAITKSGSNQLHGSLFEMHRDAALDAKNYFDVPNLPIPQFVRNQFGASVGGPIVHDRTFFFVSYEGFREVQASTAIATVPDALARQGLLPSASDPSACRSATPNGCIPIGVNPRVQPFLALLPPSNGEDNGDGTGDLITADKGATNEHRGMVRMDHNFSDVHSLFGRYIIDDSSSLVPYFGSPPGTYVPGFPVGQQARNQYFTLQDRKNFGPQLSNELRFGINRTTASTSIVDTHPGLSISRVPGRPFGMLDIAGMSFIGHNIDIPLGDFSTVYQIQEQVSRTTGRETFKFGGEFRRIQSNGPLDAAVNGLYSFVDLSPFGFPVHSNNPPLEFFLEGLPFSYLGSVPSMSDSHRNYRQNTVSGFAQDFLRVSSRLTVNAGLRYDLYSNPTEVQGRLSVIRDPATDSGPTVGKVFAATPRDLISPQVGFAWGISGDGKTVLRAGSGIFRDQLPVILFGIDRFLPPFFGIDTLIFPSFPNPQNAVLTQPLFLIQTTYHPKFPYAMQYNLNLEREITQGTILSAGYFGARGNHLTRAGEQNPFELALGHRFNPNLPSPLQMVLTDAQSFYNSFQLSVSRQHSDNFSWQVSYTLSHSIDDASNAFLIEAVNEPESQDIFNRKGSRGRSGFDIRHNFVGNVVYELPFGRGREFGGWQLSGIASVHSNVPFTPVLSFDNAGLQSVVTAERPNLIGNPYSGVCPNGTRVGTPACWFNPTAFALPPLGQFGTAGRNSLSGPGFAQFDLSLRKAFHLPKETEIAFGADLFNLLNHPNFAVPSNTQNPIALGGNGDAIFKNAAGDFADNSGRIFTTVGRSREIQLDARFIF
ncbi:MAG TPA: carboxypeptidase regulatory-like domain-containing protein [Terriglobales bacterium]|nr:carboxypeptidase regulatory-like domain-containing protein [Terriglobales bacterium]